MKKYSEQYYKDNGQSSDRPALEMYFKIIKRELVRGSNVLDYGAGNGYLSKRLATEFRSFAYEISEFAKKNIKANSPKTKLLESGFQKNYFDGIVALHSFEHVKNPEKLIEVLAESLKRGGKLLMVVPNFDGWGHKIKKNEWFGFRDKTHISLLRSVEWKNILIKNNFKISKTGSDWFWDPPYLPIIPNVFQKVVFYPGCLLMVILGRIFYPESWGEDLLILARKN